MKTLLLSLVSALTFAASASAQFQDTELKVQSHTLDRQDKINRPGTNAQELTRGLKITVKNVGTKPHGEGEIEWAILVSRPGPKKDLSSTGKEKLQALKSNEVATFDVGAVPVQTNAGKSQEMDYQVIVRRSGIEVARAVSSAAFDQKAEGAKEAKPKKTKAK